MTECYFFKQGTCTKGPNCRFRHSEPPPCPFFQMGTCKYGSSCWYSHSIPASSAEPNEAETAAASKPKEAKQPREAAAASEPKEAKHPSELELLRRQAQDQLAEMKASSTARPAGAATAAPARASSHAEVSPAEAALPSVPKPSGGEGAKEEPQPRRFGRAARERAIAMGVLPTTASESGSEAKSSGGASPPVAARKRERAPITWNGSAKQEPSQPRQETPPKRPRPASEQLQPAAESSPQPAAPAARRTPKTPIPSPGVAGPRTEAPPKQGPKPAPVVFKPPSQQPQQAALPAENPAGKAGARAPQTGSAPPKPSPIKVGEGSREAAPATGQGAKPGTVKESPRGKARKAETPRSAQNAMHDKELEDLEEELLLEDEEDDQGNERPAAALNDDDDDGLDEELANYEAEFD